MADSVGRHSSDSEPIPYYDESPPTFTEDELSGLIGPPFTDDELAGLRGPRRRAYFATELNSTEEEQCRMAVERILTGELNSLGTKLAVANERVFDQYDRLSAEASFRINVSIPISAIFVVLAWRFSPWVLLGLVLAALLMRQGFTRTRSANDLLVQSLITQAIQSTEVAQVSSYVAQERSKPSAAST